MFRSLLLDVITERSHHEDVIEHIHFLQGSAVHKQPQVELKGEENFIEKVLCFLIISCVLRVCTGL